MSGRPVDLLTGRRRSEVLTCAGATWTWRAASTAIPARVAKERLTLRHSYARALRRVEAPFTRVRLLAHDDVRRSPATTLVRSWQEKAAPCRAARGRDS